MNVIRKQLQLSQVKRWPICHVNKDQSVAEHSFNVMLITKELTSGLDDDLWLQCFAYALTHDMDEVETGDIPSPFKRKLRRECPAIIETLDGPPKASPLIRAIVKLADYLEAIYWLREYGGSRTAEGEILGDIYNNFEDFMSELFFNSELNVPGSVLEKAKWLCGSL